jgi:DNA polymerase kappa
MSSKNIDDTTHQRQQHAKENVVVGAKHPQSSGNAVPTQATKDASALVIAACDKAGMEGIDRARINAIILRESGNSSYMKQQRKRDEHVNKRIEKMILDLKSKNEKSGGGDSWKRFVERELEVEVEEHIRNRPVRSACVVVDMDMFYMACELLTRRELTSKPCCVGGGLVTTSNYVARRYGVRSAMAGFIADKLVEEISGGKEKLIHIPSNFELYISKSHEVRKVLSEYDLNMKAYSLDEVYLNIGMYVRLRLEGGNHSAIVAKLAEQAQVSKDTEDVVVEESGEDPLADYAPHVSIEAAGEVVREMRQRVFEATGLTCSAGLAPNFMLAKIASDRNKPNGQLAVGPRQEDVLQFLHPLPTRKVGGIGRVTEKMLLALGIATVKELYDDRATVRFCFKPATAKFLLRASLGCSNHESNDDNDDEIGRKGISKERTFSSGRPWGEVNEKLEEIARKLSVDMQNKNLWARTITLKVKLHTFDVMSKAKSLARGVYTQDTNDLVKISRDLLKEVRQQFKGTVFSVRLLGIRCSGFQGEQERLDASQMNIKQYFSNGAALCARSRSTSPIPRIDDEAQAIKSAPTKAEADGQTHTKASVENIGCDGKPANPEMSKKHISRQRTESAAAVEERREDVSCPICGMAFSADDNASLNSHVDACLNGPAVQAAAKEESLLAHRPTKKPRLRDFFAGKR